MKNFSPFKNLYTANMPEIRKVSNYDGKYLLYENRLSFFISDIFNVNKFLGRNYSGVNNVTIDMNCSKRR